AYWRGYREYRELGRVETLPRMMGYEAAGAAPIVHGRVIEEPAALARAIRLGNPASWQGAAAARDESGGVIEACTDEEIVAAYRLLARSEGIFAEPAAALSLAGARRTEKGGGGYPPLARSEGISAEPASAISLAGALKLGASGRLRPRDVLVLTLTGHGLKDPDTAIASSEPARAIPAELGRLAAALELD